MELKIDCKFLTGGTLADFPIEIYVNSTENNSRTPRYFWLKFAGVILYGVPCDVLKFQPKITGGSRDIGSYIYIDFNGRNGLCTLGSTSPFQDDRKAQTPQ